MAKKQSREEKDRKYQALGFVDANEMLLLAAKLDVSIPVIKAAFNYWKKYDGTKDGLLRLIPPGDRP